MHFLVKKISGAHELEVFSTDKNYEVLDGIITDDVGTKHHVHGTNLFQYSTGTTFYVYTKLEVQDLADALEDEIDGIPSYEQFERLRMLNSIIEDM